jgi:hypothetical protein
MRLAPFITQEDFWYFWYSFLLEAESAPEPRCIRATENFNYFIGNRTRHLRLNHSASTHYATTCHRRISLRPTFKLVCFTFSGDLVQGSQIRFCSDFNGWSKRLISLRWTRSASLSRTRRHPSPLLLQSIEFGLREHFANRMEVHCVVFEVFSVVVMGRDHLCGLVVRVPGYRSRDLGSSSGAIFWEVVVLERGPLSLVSTIEELLERKSSGSGLESRDYGRRDPSRWPRVALYPQTLTLTSPTSSGSSVGIVRSRTQATEFNLV